MAKTDTEIHQIELLLTLDYLLNHTDVDHPATQQDICRHATKYGLQFKGGVAGDDVKRQRIGKCLEFLSKLTEDFTDDVPFVLETTDSGKYYIEQRNGLDSTQVAKIIAAIKNDKYTRNEDVDFLVDRILSAFGTSDENKDEIKKESNRLLRGVKKLDKETLRKIRLFDKAYKENRLIKIHHKIMKTNNKDWDEFDMWYRVYLIKEYRGKLHAFILPVNNAYMHMGYVFDEIEFIPVAPGPDKDVLNYDEDLNKDFGDFEELFRKSDPLLAEKYGSLDCFIERTIMPVGGKTCIVSFQFNLALKDIIKKSFEEFFNEEFRYQEIIPNESVDAEIKKMGNVMDNWVIVNIDEPNEKRPPTHGLANISVNNQSFKAWLLSDPYGEGHVNMANFIKILKPTSLYEELAHYYYHKLIHLVNYLPERAKDSMFNALVNSVEPYSRKSDLDGPSPINLSGKSNRLEERDNRNIRSKLEEAYKNRQSLHLYGDNYLVGKTVREWYQDNKDRVCGCMTFGAFLKKFFGGKLTVEGITVEGQVFASNEIDNFALYPNRVIVINDYQFADENAKKHIELLRKGYVVDSRCQEGYKKLDNLLFVVTIEWEK